MTFRVEFQIRGNTHWTSAGSLSSEAGAINLARATAQRPGIERVRIVNGNGSVVWMA